MEKPKNVDAYIAKAPKEMRPKLREIRKAVKEVAPKALESISYGMPGYDNGRVAWFGLMKKHIGLYLRPPIIEEHKNELTGYTTTKSAVHFPLDQKLPITLIKKLVRARIKKWKICSRGHSYQGTGPCPTCWPGSKNKTIKRKSRKIKLTK